MSTIIYHNHHIIPKHAGGTDAPENMILLTSEEHAEAHLKLYEEHGRWQDKLAWLGISGRKGREELIQMAQSLGGKKNKDKKHTKEAIEKMSVAKLGKKHPNRKSPPPFTSEAKHNMSEAQMGKKDSLETRKKKSEAQKKRWAK